MSENPPQIFIAHANEDKPLVRELYAKLVKAGYKPWLDEEDLLPGQNWREEIPKALKNSDLFLACLSSTSINKRGYIQREFKMAMEMLAELPPQTIYLIPLKFDECEIPELRQSEYGLNLKDIQWLDYSKPNGFEKLVKAIEYQFGRQANNPSKNTSKTSSGNSTTEQPGSKYNLQGATIYGKDPVEFDVIVRDKNGKVVDVLEDSRKRVMRVPEMGTAKGEGVILKTPRVYPGATCHVKLKVGSIDVFDTKQLHVPLPEIYGGELFYFECDVWYKIQVSADGNCTWEVHVGPPGAERKAKFSGEKQLVPAKLLYLSEELK